MITSFNDIYDNGTNTKGLEIDYNVSIERSMSKNLPQLPLFAAVHRNLRRFGLSGCVCGILRERAQKGIDLAGPSERRFLVGHVAQLGKDLVETLASGRAQAGNFLRCIFI
jgi:hypothetical protein